MKRKKVLVSFSKPLQQIDCQMCEWSAAAPRLQDGSHETRPGPPGGMWYPRLQTDSMLSVAGRAPGRTGCTGKELGN